MKHLAALLVVAVTVLDAHAVAQTPDWTQITPASSPGARSRHAISYDSASGKVVLFGGISSSGALGDTWEYDGIDWTQITVSSGPSARINHAATYDSVRGKVVIFGGFDFSGNTFNETWEYDGGNWTQATTGTSPSARRDHAMAYDTARQKVVMFGGYAGANLNDTWEYDGTNWTQVTTGTNPGDRSSHRMVYDSARGRVVMFAGYDINFNLTNETWEYDGGNWTQVTTTSSPSIRAMHTMAYDSGRGKVVMFGGYDGIGLSDTWEYDGVNWTEQTPGSIPIARRLHAMVYDSVRGKAVMFGGYTNGFVNDTWEYGGAAVAYPSSAVNYGTGCGVPALDFSPTSNPIIGTTAGALISNAPTMFAGITFGSSDTTFNGLPILPYSLASFGMPGCYLLQSNEIFGLPAAPVSASTLQFNAPIPLNTALLTQQFYIQAYALAPGANAAQIVTSNGIAWTIGNQ